VQLTVKTFSQKKQGHAVDMKQVAAAGASAKGSPESRHQQGYDPDAEYRSHGPVRGQNEIGCDQSRDIDQYCGEKEHPAYACLFQGR